jgi:heme/copper-type cytochrome/quinol oxidase subunit 2
MTKKNSFWVSPLVWLFVGLLIGMSIGYTFYQTDIASYLPHPAGLTSTVTQTVTTSAAAPSTPVVSLIVIPDWGGATYDAFIIPANANGTIPKPATNSSGPGPNNNNITLPVNVPVRFVITNLDTALNLNFTGNATVPFTIYNDTATGQVPVQFNLGQSVKLAVSHTFVVADTDANIPIPPDTIITFTLTFTKPGVYMYYCTAPCGPGMGLVGYMEGYLIVS